MFAKKSVHQIDKRLLTEPHLTPDEWSDYVQGWALFNAHEFWDAHEAWENVWKQRPEESRIFFQGIIQLAAAYHLLTAKQRYHGMMRNFEKAEEKLAIFPSPFLGVDVHALLDAITAARAEVDRVGRNNLRQFNRSLIPAVEPESPVSKGTE